MQVVEVLQKSARFLSSKGIESARLDAELLIAHVLKVRRIDLYLQHDRPLGPNDLDICRKNIMRRAAGEPVAYINGYKHFFGYEFAVSPDVLVPRWETEGVVERALKFATSSWDRNLGRTLRILDFGTGSGCIGVSLALELKKLGIQYQLMLIDVSAAAVEIARKNVDRLWGGGEGSEIVVKLADVTTLESTEVQHALGGPADLVVANPPYIKPGDLELQASVAKFEPHLSLYSGSDGLDKIFAWSRVAQDLLASGGSMVFEIGSGQGEQVKTALMNQSAWSDVEVSLDLAGHERYLQAVRS